MNIKVPFNNYKPINQARESVVQHICNIFLNGNEFYPLSDGRGRNKTDYIESAINSQTTFKAFANWHSVSTVPNHNYIRIYRCEVEMAIKILVNHGWFIHLRDHYGTWSGYIVSKYPSIEGRHRVDEIAIDDSFDVEM